VPEGFDDEMPAFDDLDEGSVNQLIGYIKSLGKKDAE
jgi:hypothetical protein